MRGAGTLVPARFLSLLSHLCVLVTLLWESQQSIQHCLPSQFLESHYDIYHNRLVGGYGASIALICYEFLTFVSGLTMFSIPVALTSIACHVFGSITLTIFIIDSWLCDSFWIIFFFCSILPAATDMMATKDEEKDPIEQGWTFYLILAGIITTLGSSIPVGFNIGVVNTPAKLIKAFCNESVESRYNVTLSESSSEVLFSSIVSVFIVGGCAGSLLGATLANTLGRRGATIATNVLSVAGAVLFVSCRRANSVEMLFIGRLLVGLSAGLTTSIVPMYLTELAPLRLSGAIGVVCPMGVNFGVLVAQVLGLKFILGGADSWHYLLGAFGLLALACLPVLLILPESPKYLYAVRKDETRGLRELSRVRGASPSALGREAGALRAEAAADAGAGEGEGWTLWRALREPALTLPLLLACSMQAGQQTSGINAVFIYSNVIFKSAQLSDEGAEYATIGCGFINCCTAVLMIYLLPLWGRRPMLLGSTLAATVLLAALTLSMQFLDTTGVPYVCMILVLAYVFVYGFGLGPIPYFIASELFEVGPRPAGMAWGSLANWLGNFLVGMFFPMVRAGIGAYSFLVFATVTAALFLFQRAYFPETKGRTPAQVAALLSGGLRSRSLRAP